MKTKEITKEVEQEILNTFSANFENGELFRKHKQTKEISLVIGSLKKQYIESKFFFGGKRHNISAHRLIWFLKYGTWPEIIDHKDRNGKNNKLNNLRNCSLLENARNKDKYIGDFTSKYRGVIFNKNANAFQAIFKKTFISYQEAYNSLQYWLNYFYGEVVNNDNVQNTFKQEIKYKELSQDVIKYLEENFETDFGNGVLYRNKKIVNKISTQGYVGPVKCKINDKIYYFLGHQIIYFLKYAVIPTIIDHIDRDKLNNKIKNLRASNQSLNIINQGLEVVDKIKKTSTGKYYIRFTSPPCESEIEAAKLAHSIREIEFGEFNLEFKIME